MIENNSPFTYRKEHILSAPVMINLELTSACNAACRHCYNFWRDDSHVTREKIDKEKMARLIELIKQNNVFHVVLTGGEPFLNFAVLEYALMKLHESGVSTSVNSNLMLATGEKIQRLKDAGLDHVLSSLNSHIPEVNDDMFNQKGAFDKIIRGITTTVEKGVRVSVNMIISSVNKNHVYDTAKICSELGAQKIFATRLVPSVNVENPAETDLNLDHKSAMKALNDLLLARNDFGIGVGTLISYPLCLLGDLEKYSDFVGRGCPAQRGNRMVINADGETHACTHEPHSYGNVFETGIKEAFRMMRKWHDGSYLFKECKDCEYINVCGSGCRSAAYAYYKRMDGEDPLFMSKKNIKVPYKLVIPEEISESVVNNERFIVPHTIRFREENGFYSINIRWANAYTIESEIAEFLIAKQSSQEPISLSSMTGDNPGKELEHLIFKEAVIPHNPELRKRFEDGIKKGCSLNPDDLLHI
ncbi:radical SAM protein [Candidatus Latescibacterota bacterium]